MMSAEAWTFLGLVTTGLVTVVTTQIVQGQTTRRALLEAQQTNTAKTETAGRAAGRAAEAAERAAAQTVTVSNGTVPKIMQHLEDQGGMLVRLTAQVDGLVESHNQTSSRLDRIAGTLMDHLVDHTRTGEINLRGARS